MSSHRDDSDADVRRTLYADNRFVLVFKFSSQGVTILSLVKNHAAYSSISSMLSRFTHIRLSSPLNASEDKTPSHAEPR